MLSRWYRLYEGLGGGGGGRRGVAIVGRVCLLVSCLTPQQQASVSRGRTCSDNFTCCHTEVEAADQTFLPHPVTVY